MSFQFQLDQLQEQVVYYLSYQLIVFDTKKIDDNAFKNFEEKAEILPENKTSYDPDFWKGYSIIEPNAVIKNLTIENQN